MNHESHIKFLAPGVPEIKSVNWLGLWTLYVKEVRRFLKVHLQTIWAPAVTTLLYLIIFGVALGRGDRVEMGVSFPTFVAPGLIVMGMMQNAFANSSFGLLVAKMQGTIVDYLMPPLSAGELLAGMAGAAVTRAFAVGGAMWIAMLFWPGVNVIPQHPFVALFYALMGASLLTFVGMITSIWGDKFDHAAMVGNFVVAPLTLLSGTFYSVEKLAPIFRQFSYMNPFHYVIAGFRYGFIGVADTPVFLGGIVLLCVNLLLCLTCYLMLKSGWKLKQ
jgi:ABC-2 type transport system permease protein